MWRPLSRTGTLGGVGGTTVVVPGVYPPRPSASRNGRPRGKNPRGMLGKHMRQIRDGNTAKCHGRWRRLQRVSRDLASTKHCTAAGDPVQASRTTRSCAIFVFINHTCTVIKSNSSEAELMYFGGCSGPDTSSAPSAAGLVPTVAAELWRRGNIHVAVQQCVTHIQVIENARRCARKVEGAELVRRSV